MVYREYKPDELPAISDLLDQVFPGGRARPDDFRALPCDEFTVAVAEDNGRIVGAIPMVRRAFQIAPDAVLDAWIQFRVGVSDACRGQGVGKGIQDAASGFLKDRGDIILIISTSEAARPYRFYRANGFHDVAYPRTYRLPPGSTAPASHPDVYAMDTADFYAEPARRHELFTRWHAPYGGFAVRSTRYFNVRRALFRRPSYLGIREHGRDAGFLVLDRVKDSDHVMELAVPDGRLDLSARLLEAARAPDRTLIASTTPDSVLDRVFQSWAIPSPARWKNSNALVVKPLNIPAIGRKLCRTPPGLEHVDVRIWTPDREALLVRAEGQAKRTLTIELKEDMLSRLVTRRLDIDAAVRSDWVTLQGALPGDREALAAALTPAPWAFQAIDGL